MALSNMINNKKMCYVQWNITPKCNYDCSYCSTKGRSMIQDVSPYIFLNKFSKHLSSPWRFYLCGMGEPFMAPDFIKTVKGLIEMGHYVGVMTNFSAPEEKILEFCKIAGDRIFEFGASLHLEHAQPDQFFKKALLIKNIIGDKFSVHSVARKGKVAELEKIGWFFRKKGINFILQLERDYKSNNIKDPFINYNKKEKEIIKNFKKRLYDKNILRFRGHLCLSGSKYFVIDENGDAYRCSPAQRLMDKKGYLGNLLEGTFKLKNRPTVCRYEYCSCVQPIIDNLVLDKKYGQ